MVQKMLEGDEEAEEEVKKKFYLQPEDVFK